MSGDEQDPASAPTELVSGTHASTRDAVGSVPASTLPGFQRVAETDPAWPAVLLTVDIILFTIRDGRLEVLLIERAIEPFKGAWALPGGFVRPNEGLREAAIRELSEEAGIQVGWMEQLYTFGEVDRDPRGRVVTVAYFALVDSSALILKAGTDARGAAWHGVRSLPPVGFDHDRIISYALERLRYKLEYAPVAFQLLPRRFTLSQLQEVYEVILDREVDKRNFRRKVQSLGILRATDAFLRGGVHRPARLYEFREEHFRSLGGGVVLSF